MIRRWKLALFCAFVGAVFFASLGGRDIATSHEARVVETAREMAVTGWPWSAQKVLVAPVKLTDIHGMIRLTPDPTADPIAVNSWAVPLLNGEVRLQKPPLPYWCSAVLFRLFGFSEAMSRLTPALMGALGTIFIYDLLRILAGRFKAKVGAILWVSTAFIPEEFRKAMADPYLAFFTLVCVWAWIRAARSLRDYRKVSGRGDPSFLFIQIFYVAMALGILAKGPPMFLHIGLALFTFHLCYNWPVPRRVGAHLLGFVLLLLLAVPWVWVVCRQIPNAWQLWRYESVGELADNVENARPWWFYIPNVFFITLPWTMVWLAGIVVIARRRKTHPEKFFGILWLAATFVFFSFVNLKKNPYLLPALPAQMIFTAEGLAASLAIARRAHGFSWEGTALAIQSGIGIGAAILIIVIGARFIAHPMPRLDYIYPIAALLVGIGAVIILQLRKPMTWLRWQTGAYVLVCLGVMNGIEATVDNGRSAKPLCAELQARLADPDTAILRSRLPEEVAIYLPVGEQNPQAHHVLVVVDDQFGAHERSRRHVPFQIPPPENFQSSFPDARVLMVDRVTMRSAPGDARWKVFELTIDRTRFALGNEPGQIDKSD